MYLSLVYEGKTEGVIDALNELNSKYPNNADVLYLNALLEKDGEESIKKYKFILKKFPKSRFSGDVKLKIGEYYYSKGLYTKSANRLKNLPIEYPQIQNMKNVISLALNSFSAIGEQDSLKYYSLIYKSMFANLDFASKKINLKENIKINTIKNHASSRPFILQIGAFRDKQNATRLKLQVSQIGYDVSIKKIDSNDKVFYAVRVVRFKTKEKANKVGEEIKVKIGTDYRILYKPKNGND